MECDDAESFAILTVVWWNTRAEIVPEYYQSSESRGHKKYLEKRQGQNDVVVICAVFCGGGSNTRYCITAGERNWKEPKFKPIHHDIRAKRISKTSLQGWGELRILHIVLNESKNLDQSPWCRRPNRVTEQVNGQGQPKKMEVSQMPVRSPDRWKH